MNGITRNLLFALSAALLSIGTVSVLLFFEARAGHPLFSYMLANYVPAGAIAAGLIAAAGLLFSALLLRARPAPILLIALLAVSAGTVFLAQSAELMLASAGRAPASDPATFAQFLTNAVLHSPVQFQGSESSSSSSSPSAMGLARAIPQSGPDNNAQVDSISSGVQGVVASQDVGANVSAGGVQRISQIGDGIQSINSAVQNHGSQWLLMAIQFVGLSFGSVLVFSFLRSRPHCDDCSVLLSGKGSQKRYFDRQEEINGSVEDVLSKAKNRRLQLSIQAHGSRGSVRKGKLSEFASIVNVSLCKRCHTHRVDFRALRKSGLTWKEIAVLAYSASSFDPLEIGG
jgi:hypothetical protein